MSQSIEKLALDLQSQVKTLAEEKSTYTERMQKMEDAMEAYRTKCEMLEATMKEYNDKMASLVKAMEEQEEDEEEETTPEPTPEPMSSQANTLGGVNEQVLSTEMPKQERKREGQQAGDETVTITSASYDNKGNKVASDEAPTPKAEEAPVQAKAEEVKPEPVAEATPSPAPVAEAAPTPAPAAVEKALTPKAEAVVSAVKAEIPAEILAKIAEVDALKAALAAEVEARKEALASVGKVKTEFESLAERIAKFEKEDLKAEKVIAKKVAEMAVEPVAAAIATEAEKTPEQVVAEFNKLAQTDSKAARKFYLANEETIRTFSFGKNAKKA